MDARPASTVILVRDAVPEGIEVFMLRRSAQSAFAPGAYVFPGGTVDAEDRSKRAHYQTRGIEKERLRRLFRMKEPPEESLQASLVVTALRELFEESGILFASDGAARVVDWEKEHRAFLTLLEERGWTADATPLELFSHWMTPQSVIPKYDVYFFVAELPRGQTAVADAFETHDGVWIAPADAVARSAASQFSVIYPTRKHLERLCGFRSVHELLEFARTKRILTVRADGDDASGFSVSGEIENAW